MKKYLILCVLAAAAAGFSFAQNATAVYVQGDTSAKSTAGSLFELVIGDDLKSGESVITKANGRAELELENKSTLSVKPNTVFTLGEVELEGEKQSVLSTTVGSVAFRLNKFSGRGPAIRTPSAVGGVRGTEFTVYAGMDGSSLLVVEKGAVELAAQGSSVLIAPNEGVEVRPGEVPGEKFSVIGRAIDFKAWNEGRLDAFLKDPVGTLKRVETQLASYRNEMQKILPDLEAADKESARVYEELKKAVAAKDDAAAAKLRNELNTGVGDRRRVLFLNKRYYALSYLSMRRFVLGGMYVQMKSRYILRSGDPVYRDFLALYESIRRNYEETIVPHMVEADI